MERDTGSETGILPQELLHLVRVSGKDNDEIVAPVLHLLNDRIDRLVSVQSAAFLGE